MDNQLSVNDYGAALQDSAVEAGAHELVRQLILLSTGSGADAAILEAADQTFEMILNVEVDGVCCLLFRMLPQLSLPPVTLSPREREIARMVAKGYPNKTIAAVLDISVWTVCTHLRRIFSKLDVHSRVAMAARLKHDDLNNERSTLAEFLATQRS